MPKPEKRQLPDLNEWVLLGVLLSVALIRFRLIGVPLERDEGEYAYGAQLLLNGLLPYEHLYHIKLPGIYAIYALMISVFGQTHTGIHTALIAVNASSSVLLFSIARRLFNPLVGTAAAASFAILSINPSVQGVFANAEHFVVLLALLGLRAQILAFDSKRPVQFWIAGLFFGAALVTKQHGFAFALAAGVLHVVHNAKERQIATKHFCLQTTSLVGGILAPYLAVCAVFAWSGSFEEFWFWTYQYAAEYSKFTSSSDAIKYLGRGSSQIFRANVLLWLLAGVGLSSPLWSSEAKRQKAFVYTFAVCSLLAIIPGFVFRLHYYVLLLPASALCIALAINAIHGFAIDRAGFLRTRHPGLLVLCGLVAASLVQHSDFYFSMSSNEATQALFGSNPFPESLEIGDYLRTHTDDDETVAIIGSEPQILFYAQRRSATGFIYMYTLMEDHALALPMQMQMIREIEAAKPRYLVYIDPRSIRSSWLMQQTSPVEILNWALSYKSQHYERVGMIEIFESRSFYRWDEQSYGGPRSTYWVEVLKRKG